LAVIEKYWGSQMEQFLLQLLPSALLQAVFGVAIWRLLKKEGQGKEI
jgi:hypothetical protein